MAFAGWITIGTRNDTSKFDKQMAQLEKKISDRENKKIELQTELSTQERQLEEARKKVDELAEAYEKVSQAQKIIDSGNATPQEFMDAAAIQQTYGSLEQVNSAFDKAMDAQDKIEGQVNKTRDDYDNLEKEVSEYKAQVESINLQKHQAEVKSLKDGFDNVGKSIQGSVKNVGRMIVGIFGLRSAYMALRQASSTLAQYDKTYAANLEYIRWALAQAVAPILRYIVSLAATLLNYVYAILNAWFGLFGNLDLSAKAFTKMKAGASGAAKAAKEIKKQLAGFDEMNVLQDQSSGGGGKAGSGTPNFDLGAMQGKRPEWLDWIIKNKDLILAILPGIAGALLLIKLGLGAIKALGIGVAIAGVVYAIENLLKYLKDPSWENFGKIVTGIGIAILGIGIATGQIIPIIVGVLVALSGIVMSYWDSISQTIEDKLSDMEDAVSNAFSKFGKGLGGFYQMFVWTLKKIYEFFKTSFESIRLIFDGFIEVVRGIINGDFTQIWEGAKKIILGVISYVVNQFLIKWQLLIGLLGMLLNIVKTIFEGIGGFLKDFFGLIWNFIKDYFGLMKGFILDAIALIKTAFTNLWDSFKNKASEAWNNVKSVFSNIGNFFGGIWNTIKSKFTDIGQRVGNAVGGAFRTAVNAVLSAAQRVINGPINAINRLISVINAVPGISLGRLSTIRLPRLATGAIINMPNRGVNIGGAIAGESGREGILPLTDTRAMQMLGEEIGKWIVINANITNTMNGRVISRELQKIQNDENFAYNS